LLGAGLLTPPNSGHGRETGPNATYGEAIADGKSLTVGDASRFDGLILDGSFLKNPHQMLDVTLS
jgi:hypothetical protein